MKTVIKDSFMGPVIDSDNLGETIDNMRKQILILAHEIDASGMDINFGADKKTSFKIEIIQDLEAAIQDLEDARFTINKYYGGEE